MNSLERMLALSVFTALYPCLPSFHTHPNVAAEVPINCPKVPIVPFGPGPALVKEGERG